MKVHKTPAEAREHLRDSIPKIGQRYEASTQRASWAEAAASEEAENNFNAAMTIALSERKRQTRCRDAGDSVYREGCKLKGVPIIGSRITLALDKYMTNLAKVMTPVLAVVDSLPRRGLDAMANIDNRLKPTVQALIAKKLKK